MSRNIHSGRIIRAGIAEAHRLLLSARPGSLAVGRGIEVAWMTGEAVDAIDKARLNGGDAESPLHQAWCTLMDRQREVRRTMQRDPAIDLQFELWLFPMPKRTLVYVHTEQRAFADWFDALPFVEDHSWWDSTDPPDDVAPPTWARRGRDWTDAMPVGHPPAARCLSMSMYDDGVVMPASPEEAVPHVPPVARRLAHRAALTHVDERYRAIVEERRALEPGWKPQGFSEYLEARRLADADADRRAAITRDISDAIREIGAEDLAGG